MNTRTLHLGWDVLRSIFLIKMGKRIPLYCEWEITYRCNMHCAFCATLSEGRNSKTDMSTKDALNVIDQLADLGTRIIHFTGGEPTLRNDLPELIKAAQDRRILVTFTTNGSADEKRMAPLLNADLIRISLDGVGQVHDLSRNCSGAYDRAIGIIRYCLSKNKKIIIATTYSNKSTIRDMEELLCVANKLGIQVSILPVSKNIGTVRDAMIPCDLSPTFDDYILLMEKLDKKFTNTIADSKHYIKILKAGGLDKYGCRVMDVAICIKADRSVSMPCTGLQLISGTGDLSEIYYSDEAISMRKRQGHLAACNECTMRCMISASALLKTGDFISIINSYIRSMV